MSITKHISRNRESNKEQKKKRQLESFTSSASTLTTSSCDSTVTAEAEQGYERIQNSTCGSQRLLKREKKKVRFNSKAEVKYIPSKKEIEEEERRKLWIQNDEHEDSLEEIISLGMAINSFGKYKENDTFFSNCWRNKVIFTKKSKKLKNEESWYEEKWIVDMGSTSRGAEQFSTPKTYDTVNEDRIEVIRDILTTQRIHTFSGAKPDPEELSRISLKGSRRAVKWARVKAVRDAQDAILIQSSTKAKDLDSSASSIKEWLGRRPSIMSAENHS